MTFLYSQHLVLDIVVYYRETKYYSRNSCLSLSLHLLPMGKGCLEYIYTYKLLKDKVKCKNIRLTLKCASITTMTTDFLLRICVVQ